MSLDNGEGVVPSRLETVGQLFMMQVRCCTFVLLCGRVITSRMQNPYGVSEDMVVVKLVRG